MAKTLIGLFDNLGDAQAAVRTLVARGIAQDDIGFMADQQHELPGTAHLNESEGAVAGAESGVVLAGGLIGGLTRLGVSEEQAHHYAGALRRGGILVTIAADRPAQAELAVAVLREHAAAEKRVN